VVLVEVDDIIIGGEFHVCKRDVDGVDSDSIMRLLYRFSKAIIISSNTSPTFD
jgi:hypothetical protein